MQNLINEDEAAAVANRMRSYGRFKELMQHHYRQICLVCDSRSRHSQCRRRPKACPKTNFRNILETKRWQTAQSGEHRRPDDAAATLTATLRSTKP